MTLDQLTVLKSHPGVFPRGPEARGGHVGFMSHSDAETRSKTSSQMDIFIIFESDAPDT